MLSKFLKLSEEKQKNIISAAVKEFGEKGFDNASTDVIAEVAGIAKGSLFHYFGSKKNLYLFIVEYSTEFFTEEVLKGAENIESRDFYERIKEISIIKQDMIIKYPLQTKIITDAFMNMPAKLKNDLERLYVKYYTSNMKFMEEYLLKYLDEALLKANVRKEDAVFITMTLFDALTKKYMEVYKDKSHELISKNEEIIEEFDRYIDIIKYGLYK